MDRTNRQFAADARYGCRCMKQRSKPIARLPLVIGDMFLSLSVNGRSKLILYIFTPERRAIPVIRDQYSKVPAGETIVRRLEGESSTRPTIRDSMPKSDAISITFSAD